MFAFFSILLLFQGGGTNRITGVSMEGGAKRIIGLLLFCFYWDFVFAFFKGAALTELLGFREKGALKEL